MTSAPRQPRISVACEPKPSRVKSSTRTPPSAFAGPTTLRSLSLTRVSATRDELPDGICQDQRLVLLHEVTRAADGHVCDVAGSGHQLLEDPFPSLRCRVAIAVRGEKRLGPCAKGFRRRNV